MTAKQQNISGEKKDTGALIGLSVSLERSVTVFPHRTHFFFFLEVGVSIDATHGSPESLTWSSSLPVGPAEGPRYCVCSELGVGGTRNTSLHGGLSLAAEGHGTGETRNACEARCLFLEIARGSLTTLGSPGQVQRMAHRETEAMLCALDPVCTLISAQFPQIVLALS